MAKDDNSKKEMHDGKQTEDSQEKKLMDEQYEFGLNEDVREEIEQKDEDHKEPKDKADRDDAVINKEEVKDETDN